MPENSSNIKPTISIHLFNDGFFFSAFAESNYYEFEDLNLLTNKGFDDFVRMNGFNQDHEPRILLFDNPSMFIPSLLFDIDDSEEYLSNYTSLKFNHEIVHETTEDGQIEIIYQRNNKVNSIFENFFKKVSFRHYSTILYNNLNEHIKSNFDNGIKLFVHLQKNQFDLFLFKKNRLLIYNCFPHSNNDDFLYYLFALVEQYDLSPSAFEIIFLGKFDYFKTYYLTLEGFHEKISFIKKNAEIRGNESHPAPYFSKFL